MRKQNPSAGIAYYHMSTSLLGKTLSTTGVLCPALGEIHSYIHLIYRPMHIFTPNYINL